MNKKVISIYFISIFFLMFFVTFNGFAISYTINFNGAGASSNVDSVIVQNLTQGTTVVVPTGNCLYLSDIPNKISQHTKKDEIVRIYTNPAKEKTIVTFFAKQSGKTQISLFGIDGKMIIDKNKNLNVGENTFQISVPKGAYAISIKGNGYSYTNKLISQVCAEVKPEIDFLGNAKKETILSTSIQDNVSLRSSNVTTYMLYTQGDRLLFKGISENYSTIVVAIPTQDKTITFNFVDCTDGEGYHYPVVKIGNQTWMAENLKTTKNNNGSSIPLWTSAWGTLSTPYCCFYNNDSATYKNSWGALYNWFAVNTNITPIGWHVPSNNEWEILKNYLRLNVNQYGSVSNALAATSNWQGEIIGKDLTKNNNTGFTALPTGLFFSQEWYETGTAHWWSSTELDTNTASSKMLADDYLFGPEKTLIDPIFPLQKTSGCSVRCVLGDEIKVTTTTVSGITSRSAICGGSIGGGSIVTARGVCWSTSANPTTANNKTIDGAGTGGFTSSLTGLTLNTLYHIRAYATTSKGTTYGSDSSFITKPDLPTVTTVVSDITTTSAIVEGSVTSDGGSIITSRGIFYSGVNGTIQTFNGSGLGNFKITLTGLTPGTQYSCNAWASNIAGTGFGNNVLFSTIKPEVKITDVDGNIYHEITIGTQTWMLENLKTTRYRNGEVIGTTLPASKNTSSEISPKYQWAYNGVEGNVSIRGRLYTWYAVNDNRNIAPVGWHVPSDDEWTTLVDYLIANGYNYDGFSSGNKLAKSLATTTDWTTYTGVGTVGNDLSKNNTSGFTALPGGFRNEFGSFSFFNEYVFWWSATENSSTLACNRGLAYIDNMLSRDYQLKNWGCYVRCVKDGIPSITTTAPTDITSNSAIIGGNITVGDVPIVIASGICWSTNINPTTANSKTTGSQSSGSFTNSITGLLPNTKYYVRAYATNSKGTAYGNEFSLITYAGSVTDSDGNLYYTVKIGTQEWMVENLKTTKYNDGTNISYKTGNIHGYSFIDNDVAFKSQYGALYDWYTVKTGKLAPTGWHIPTDAEWTTLENYLITNGYNYDGTTLKNKIAKALATTSGWGTSMYIGAIGNDLTKNNSSRFSALPGGFPFTTSKTDGIIYGGGWWTSTENSTTYAWSRSMTCNSYNLIRTNILMDLSVSVRCVKD